MRLVLATPELLQAAASGPDDLASLLTVDVPDGWPEFPEAIDATIEFLQLFPEQAAWAMYFFVDDDVQSLVGSGGFKGAPLEGMVEIGYEIAPGWRGQGLATAAASSLIEVARESGQVGIVAAHTLASENPSMGVLRKLGFVLAATTTDPEVGSVCRWHLEL